MKGQQFLVNLIANVMQVLCYAHTNVMLQLFTKHLNIPPYQICGVDGYYTGRSFIRPLPLTD